MSDIAKWALLVAGALVLVGLILALPFMQAINGTVLAEGIVTIVNICSECFLFARGLINNLFSPWARNIISGLLLWLMGKWLMTTSIKIMAWIYHFIFK